MATRTVSWAVSGSLFLSLFIGGISLGGMSACASERTLLGASGQQLLDAQPAGSQSTEITLVQSIPLETTLAQPDLPAAKDAWVKMIAGAKSSIDMGQFYLSNEAGSPLEPVIQELEKAGARGVKIRVIVDTTMTSNDPATYDRFKKIQNGEMRVLDLKKITGGIIHAKYFVMDHEQVYVGSQNFDWKALNQIHEMGVLFRDTKIAAQLTEIFNTDWEICRTGVAPAPIQTGPIQPSALELVASPPQFNPADVRYSLTALKELLANAKKSIRFQVMEYSTAGKAGRWGEIDDALRAAAARGVKVELMISDWSTGKPTIDQLKDLQKTPGISIKIVSFPPFSGGCISFSRTMHSKMMVVDGETLWMGTSNWSESYFTSVRGVEMILKMPEFAAQGNRVLDTLWNSSYAALLDPLKTYKPPVRTCPAGGEQ